MRLDICICTRNPRLNILEQVIKSICDQEMVKGLSVGIVVVDNASHIPLTHSIFKPIYGPSVSTQLIQEPLLGIARARATAATATQGEWILFVDDDNELHSDYILNGFKVICNNPRVGCFGGKLLLPKNIRPPKWCEHFLPFLGIKDFGDQPIERISEHWGPWEPPTAGAFVHRNVLQEYLRRAEKSEDIFKLGRTAGKLFSCEDSILMRGAAQIGRSNAYEPTLALNHHLAPFRFKFSYLVKLMYGYGISHVLLDKLLGAPPSIPEYYQSKRPFLKLILSTIWTERKKSIQFAIGMVAYHLGARREYLVQQPRNKL